MYVLYSLHIIHVQRKQMNLLRNHFIRQYTLFLYYVYAKCSILVRFTCEEVPFYWGDTFDLDLTEVRGRIKAEKEKGEFHHFYKLKDESTDKPCNIILECIISICQV